MAFDILQRFRDSENFFEFNLLYLFWVGLWPDYDLSKTKRLMYKIYQYTLHTFSVILLIITGIGTYQNKNNITIFISNLDKSIVAYNYIFKIILFISKRDKILDLVQDISESGDRIKDRSRNDMIKHALVVTSLNSSVMLAFSMFGLHKGEMSIEAWMPFDAKKDKMSLALSVQLIALLFCLPFSYRAMGIQGIVCSLLIYLCDQLEDLQERLRKLKYLKENEVITKLKMKMIVKKHIRLMKYANKMDIIFKEYYLVQNLAITMELCLNAMMVIVVGKEQKFLFASFVAFLVCALINAYIYCYLGNQLMDQSEQIAYAAYETDWTSWPVCMRKDLLLIIKVAQRPLQVSAGGIDVMNMKTFGAALYNGYSIFAVLNDVVN